MVRLVKYKEKQKKKPGRPTNLIVEDQILLTLQYIARISNLLPYRNWLENLGINYVSYRLKNWKYLNPISKIRDARQEKVIRFFSWWGFDFNGVRSSPIERPTQHQKSFYRGKQRQHTLKTQVVFGQKSNQIICLAHSKGKTHDFKLFKNSRTKFHKFLKVIADKGYQGLAKLHNLSETPIKKSRGKKLSKDQKKYNRELNRLRIAVEHVNRRLKIFKILSYPYRNRHRRFGLRSNLIAGIYDAKLVL